MNDSSNNKTEKPPSYLFIIGAPRSGTTWLQILLAQHPDVATTSETHVYTQYINLFLERWQFEKNRKADGYKVSGLTQVIDEEKFHQLLGNFAEGILDEIKDKDKSVVVEKTPENTFFVELIHKNFPNAYFLHIIPNFSLLSLSTISSASALASALSSDGGIRTALVSSPTISGIPPA